MSHDLPKAYDPTAIEDRWAEYWVREKLFDVPSPEGAPMMPRAPSRFCYLRPTSPAACTWATCSNQTEMDILTRWQRMLGDRTLWVPGTDHAGHCHTDDGGTAAGRQKGRRGRDWDARPSSNAYGSGSSTTAARFSTR